MPADEMLTSTLAHIPPEECLQLVASLSIGRIAVALPDGPPLVVPINYILDGETVVFRSDPGTKLYALREQPISFQVDFVDPFHRTGWSVLIQGVAYEATELEVNHLELESWAGGNKQHWVRLVATTVTGRRIHLPDIPRDSRGYL